MSDNPQDKTPKDHTCFKELNTCPFCDGEYFTNGDVKKIPKITDVEVIDFFDAGGYGEWTHAVCLGMKVKTHAQLLKVGFEVFKKDETSILGLLEDRHKRFFQNELILYQMKHRKWEHFLIRDAWPQEEGFYVHL